MQRPWIRLLLLLLLFWLCFRSFSKDVENENDIMSTLPTQSTYLVGT